MKTRTMFGMVIPLVMLILHGAFAQAPACTNPDYDAVRDFSIQANPNGVWSYGWEPTVGGPLTLYTVADSSCTSGLSRWIRDSDCGGAPLVVHNDTGKPFCDTLNDICIPAVDLDLHPGPNGDMSVVRWTAPSSGRFLLQGAFEALDAQEGGTDVHVVVNSKRSLLSGPASKYMWPLTFQMVLSVSGGDTVDFAVGFGKDGNYTDDSTGLRFKVTRLGS